MLRWMYAYILLLFLDDSGPADNDMFGFMRQPPWR